MQLIWPQHPLITTLNGAKNGAKMNRLRSLDGLRGFAALSIVFWHWQHFFFLDGLRQPGWGPAKEPFFELLWPFYVQGWAAVDIFFVLSGFVFFWLYAPSIRERVVGGWAFARLRFSRLYPLHFLLLILVALLQLRFFQIKSLFFVYQANDWPHFLAQLFMVQNWWPFADKSFDGPAWSVSIEVLLYVIFFFACRAGLRRGLHCLAIALIGGLLLPVEEHFARGIIGFFMGGFVFTLWDKWKDHGNAAALARYLCLAAVAGWVLLCASIYYKLSWIAGEESNNLFLAPFDFVLCPLTVLALALREQVYGASRAIFAFLGDISYASYLLHFPMQLALALAASRFGWGTEFFMQGWVMIAFFAALFGLSAVVHYRFERPLQRAIRGSIARRAAAMA
jgi:peptidoglycan/LPS O-acetylase OafA/YrhL